MSTATKKIPQKPAGRELFFLNTTIIFWGRNDKDKDIKRKRARIDRMLVGWRRFSSWIFMFCCLYREKALCWLWSLASILRLLTCSVKKLCFFFFYSLLSGRTVWFPLFFWPLRPASLCRSNGDVDSRPFDSFSFPIRQSMRGVLFCGRTLAISAPIKATSDATFRWLSVALCGPVCVCVCVC